MVAGRSGKIIAIIPARGGSKRIPNKNILDFEGKPMIEWTIEAARTSGLFDRIVVSTDSEKIAEISVQGGAEVPFLRMEKADDHSQVSEATLYTLERLEGEGEAYEWVVQLMPVCPLRNDRDIIKAWEHFRESGAAYQVSCFKFHWMNPWWAVKLDESMHPEWIFQDSMKRSQDLPELYCPTGAIWIANTRDLKKSGTFYGNGHIFWEMDWKRAVDIDNYEDLEMAKVLKSMADNA